MNFQHLDKDKKLKSTVSYLAEKFGADKFKIKDYWDADLCSIGLTDNDEKYLFYISTHRDNYFFVSIEKLEIAGQLPYELLGKFENLGLAELEKLFAEHLRLAPKEHGL